jgi:hypothetical protein
MTREQIEAMAQQLLAVAAALHPQHAAAIRGLVAVATSLNTLIAQIKSEDPEAWDAVAADYNASLAAFKASVELPK